MDDFLYVIIIISFIIITVRAVDTSVEHAVEQGPLGKKKTNTSKSMADKLESEFLGTISTGTFNNDYNYMEPIGKGGYGEVFKVRSKKDYHIYALKRMRFDQHKRKKYLPFLKREIINNAKLSHENVVRYYDSWVEVSANQSLVRNASYESETDQSESKENLENVEDLRNTNSGLKRDDMKHTNNNAVKSTRPTVNQEDSSTTSNDSECSGLNNATHTVHGPQPTETVPVTKETISDIDSADKIQNIAHAKMRSKEILPNFKQLQISFEDDKTSTSSDSAIVEEVSSDEKTDSNTLQVTRSDEAGHKTSISRGNGSNSGECDIIFDEAAVSLDVKNEVESKLEDETEDESDVCSDSEDPHDCSLKDLDIAGILEEISNSEHIVFPHQLSKDASRSANDTGNMDVGEPRFLDLYIKMEFCHSTLREAIDNGALVNDDAKCWSYFRQIVRGLDYIHGKGITHRDLTPRNIFITIDDVVKIGDFGLSRLHADVEAESSGFGDRSLELPSQAKHKASTSLTGGVGTVWYTAPEVLNVSSAKYGHEIDLFSLGLVFFEMCHVPLVTEQEKASIFIKLRNERIFPDTFDQKSKANQMKLISKLLAKKPEDRGPLAKLLSYLPPEPLEEVQFKRMLPLVISKPDGELFRVMMQQLYSQKMDKVLPSVQYLKLTDDVIKLRKLFVEVAERHGARQINLPLFLPLKEVVRSDKGDNTEPNAFLDCKGSPVELCDSALAAFLYKHEVEKGTFHTNDTFYSTNTFYRRNAIIEYPQISFFSMAGQDDLIAIGRALLILQDTLLKTGQSAGDFIICLTHRDIEEGLLQIYDLKEIEQTFLYRLCELVGDTSLRLKLLKQLKESEINIPQILVVTGSINKMAAKLEGILGRLHRHVHGFNMNLADKVRDALEYLINVKVIIEKFGVSIDTKLELFMRAPQEGVLGSGIKFRLKSKSGLQTLAHGGHLVIEGRNNPEIKDELLWFEIYVMKVKEADVTTTAPDVIIIYDQTSFDEVKSTADLYRKLTGTGLRVSEFEKSKGDIHVTPYCRFLIQLNMLSGLPATLLYEEDSKVKQIPMKLQTVLSHVERAEGRRKVPPRRWLLI